MIIIVDLDGTLCTQQNPGEYHKAEPIQDRIDIINMLHDQGHRIHITTARKEGILSISEQLNRWGVKYNLLTIGKPACDVLIDDRAINFNEPWLPQILSKATRNSDHIT